MKFPMRVYVKEYTQAGNGDFYWKTLCTVHNNESLGLMERILAGGGLEHTTNDKLNAQLPPPIGARVFNRAFCRTATVVGAGKEPASWTVQEQWNKEQIPQTTQIWFASDCDILPPAPKN